MKKTLAIILTTMILMSSLSWALSPQQTAGDTLKSLGIIKGDENGNLNMDEILSREQSIAILNRMMDEASNVQKSTSTSSFSDVPTTHWAAKDIAYAKNKNWTKGTGNNTFGLGKQVTTQEFLTLILRALGHTELNVYNSAIAKAGNYELLKNTTTQNAATPLTRGDAFIIMLQALNAKPVGSDITLMKQLGLNVTSNYPLTLTDGEGQTITIDKEPMKIVSMAPSVTEILFSIGAGDKLVGRTDYCDYPLEVSSIPSIGTLKEPSIEKIVELNPDLVLASTHFTEETYAQLNNLGIKVYVLKSQENFEGLYKTLTEAGQITNHSVDATNVINDIKERVQTIKHKVSGLTAVTCYYSVATGETEYTATGDTFISDLLEMAGGNNIAKDGKMWSYSVEKLLEHDPEIILVDQNFNALNTFTELEVHKDLNAVKQNKVIEINGSRISRLSPRIIESLEEVTQILHPEISKNNTNLYVISPIVALTH